MKIEIIKDGGHGDCETCGYYEWDDIKIVVDGKEVGSFFHDGHLGGGDPERAFDPYDNMDLLVKALKCILPESEIIVTHQDHMVSG